MELSGVTAVVTGAGSGLGEVIAAVLAGAGAVVVVADRDRTAAVDELHRPADQPAALLHREVVVLLRLDPGGDHHRGIAIVDDVVDLFAQDRFIDLQVRGERRERRNDQTGLLCR